MSQKKPGDPNRSAHNDMKSLCHAYVRQHLPHIYEQFQQALGIKPKALSERNQRILDALELIDPTK